MSKRKNWDAEADGEEYEKAQQEAADLHASGEPISPYQRRRLGGLSCRQQHGYQHYRDMSRKRWGKQ